MRKDLIALCTLAAFGAFLVATDPAEAARRDGLSNSELIEDKDDIFTYPQLSVDYDNLVSFEYGGQYGQGNAIGLAGGDSFALGFALQRGAMFEMRGLGGGITRAVAQGANPGNLESGSAAPSPLNFDLVPSRSYPYPAPDTGATNGTQNAVNGRYGGYQQNHTVFDFFGGYELANGSLGARLSLGIGGAKFEGTSDDAERTSDGQGYFLFRGGYSGTFDGFSLDTSLSFVTNSGDNNALSSGDDQTTAGVTGFAIDGRAYNKFNDEVSLGALFDLGFTSLSQTQDGADNSPQSSASNFLIQAGAGPVFTIGGGDESEEGDEVAQYAQFGADEEEGDGDETMSETESDEGDTATDATTPNPDDSAATSGSSEKQMAESGSRAAPTARKPAKQKASSFDQSAEIGAYSVIGFSSVSGDPNSEAEDDGYSMSSLVLPGFHLAGEVHVLKWLYFRSGAQYYFHHFESRFNDADGENVAGGDSSNFGWSAGMGVEVGNFRFDGAFNQGFLRGGPNFISGYSGGLFATASAQYRW